MDSISICAKLQNSELRFLKSDEEKLKYLFTTYPKTKKLQDYVSKMAQIYANSHRKSQTRFRSQLKQASVHFKAAKYESAISCYTKAIMNCKFPSESVSNQLAICYALRSKAFYQCNQIKCALFDANQAFDLYPTVKMLRQRINCMLLLERKCEALDAIKKASELWISEDIAQYLSAIKENIVLNYKEIKTELESSEQSNDSNIEDSIIRSFVHENYLMTTCEEKGRCVVAKEDMLNDTLVVEEEPLAASIFATQFRKHCCNCLKAIDHQFYPCQWCNEVVFCGKKCPKFNYHRYECGIAGLLEQMGNSFYLVYRLMTRIGCETALDFNQKEKNKSCGELILLNTHQNAAKSTNEVYKAFLTLFTHSNKMKEVMKVFTYVVALNVTFFLRHTKAFVCDNRELSKYIAITGVIHANIMRIYVNCFGVFVWRNGKNNHIGNCVAYDGAFFSHSCDPNIRWSWHNGSLQFKAMRYIKKGEELCITYGPTYRTLQIANRKQILLKKYYFECHCHACVNQTPNLSAFKCRRCVNGAVKYELSSKSAKCFSCGEYYVNIEELVSTVKTCKVVINDMIKNLDQKINVDLSLAKAEKIMTKWSKIAIQTCADVVNAKKQLHEHCIKLRRYDYAMKFL